MRYGRYYNRGSSISHCTGYVANWHSGEIVSGTYTLSLSSVSSGVATYQYASSGLILTATCTPTTDGRYTVFFVCVPCRTTSRVWGLASGDPESEGINVKYEQLWAPRIVSGFVPPTLPPNGPRPFESLSEMRSGSVTTTETPVITGVQSARLAVYTFRQACHAVTVGARLSCPSPTVTGTSAVQTEQITASAAVTGGAFPLIIRSSLRISIPYVQTNWRFRGTGDTSPGIHVLQLNPTPGEDNYYGPEYRLNFGFPSGNFSTVVNDGLFSVYRWFDDFNRNLDITAVRAVFTDSTQQWPST